MAIARQTTAKLVKPLEGAIIQRYTAGAAIAAGEIVAMQSDGAVDPANTTSAVVTFPMIAIQAAAAGEVVDCVVSGRINCVTGGTPGAICYASDTAGEPAESAGTNLGIVGWVETATIIFVNPQGGLAAASHSHA